VLLAPGRTVTLDAVDGKRSFGEIIRKLAEKFNAPVDQITQDCTGLLGALRARRFLDVSP